MRLPWRHWVSASSFLMSCLGFTLLFPDILTLSSCSQLRCASRRASCCSDLLLAAFHAKAATLPEPQRAAVLCCSNQVLFQKETSKPAHLWDLRLQGLRKATSPGLDRVSRPVLTFPTHPHVATAGEPIETRQRVSPPSLGSQPPPLLTTAKLRSVGHAFVSCPAAL